MPEKYKYIRRHRRTGRKKTVYLNKAVVVTFNVEAARGLNADEKYSWEWKFAMKSGKPIARITKLFGEGSAGSRQAKRWELDRKDDIRMWMVGKKTKQVFEVRAGGPLVPHEVAAYLEEVARFYHPNTYENKKRFLEDGGDTHSALAERFKYKPLNEIDRRLLQDYLDSQYPDKADQASNRKYMAHRKELMSFFSQWIMKRYPWDVNPARELEARRSEKVERKVITKEQFDKLLEKAEGQARNMLATYWWSGGRRSGVQGLKWSDVDFEGGTLRIQSAKSRDGSVTAKLIPLLSPLVPFLQDQEKNYKHLSKDGSVFINLNPSHKNTKHYLCGYRYNSNFVARHCEDAGVPVMSFHAVRRGIATWLYDHDASYEDIQAILAHDDVETTKRYVHSLRPSRKAKRALEERIAVALNGGK